MCLLFGVFNLEAGSEETTNKILKWAHQHQYFRELDFKTHEKEFIRLAKEGQTPKALYIGCSDSRVLPELLTNTRPGDLFVVRSAGNFVPKWNPDIKWDGVAASIVYAVDVLNINVIIVCGHSQCGAIEGLFKSEDLKNIPYLNNWLQFGEAAKKIANTEKYDTKEALYDATARLSVLFQLEHLLEYPTIKKRVKEGSMHLLGWYFDIKSGNLEFFDADKDIFVPMKSIQ